MKDEVKHAKRARSRPEGPPAISRGPKKVCTHHPGPLQSVQTIYYVPILLSSSRCGDSLHGRATRAEVARMKFAHVSRMQIFGCPPLPTLLPSICCGESPLESHACRICDANFQSDMRGRCQLSENADDIHQIYFRIEYPNLADFLYQSAKEKFGPNFVQNIQSISVLLW